MGKQWDKGNYCTLAPDNILGVYLGNICLQHDIEYINKEISRKEADLMLRESIRAYGGVFNIIGYIYYFFVRIFGRFYW